MKLIGGLHLVGATHLVDRSSLLAFLEEVLAAPTVAEGVARRWLAAEPAPDGRGLRQLQTTLPAPTPPRGRTSLAAHTPANLSPGARHSRARYNFQAADKRLASPLRCHRAQAFTLAGGRMEVSGRCAETSRCYSTSIHL
jgi:hypothetical protein